MPLPEATYSDALALGLFAVGGLCALLIRTMPAGPRRGWIKLAALIFIGGGFVNIGLAEVKEQMTRLITPVHAVGTLLNLHTEPSGAKGSPVQHYNVQPDFGSLIQNLHDSDALFFMKAANGEHVDLTYTKESGYVSDLCITGSPHIGYCFHETDARNTTGGYFFIIAGIILALSGMFQWIVDHNADPELAD